jgi:hypothetical protein
VVRVIFKGGPKVLSNRRNTGTNVVGSRDCINARSTVDVKSTEVWLSVLGGEPALTLGVGADEGTVDLFF